MSQIIILLFIATFIFVMAYYNARCNPAKDIDKAILIESCQGDHDAVEYVRIVLAKKYLQRDDVEAALYKVKKMIAEKQAKIIINNFSEESPQ